MPGTAIVGTGFYVPERIVTNEELTRYMDTSDEWIVERTGIRERRWVTDGMSGTEMARRAWPIRRDAADGGCLVPQEPAYFGGGHRGRASLPDDDR